MVTVAESEGALERDGETIAWRRIAGTGPTVLWLGVHPGMLMRAISPADSAILKHIARPVSDATAAPAADAPATDNAPHAEPTQGAAQPTE